MEAQESETSEQILQRLLVKYPDDWGLRKQLAGILFNEDKSYQAAELIWDAPEIPNIDLEIAYAAKILSRGAPRRAIRLLTTLLEQNQQRPAQNLGMANALLHHGMVMQAARFYGAALQADPDLANPDLENFLIWTDDYEKIWGTFKHSKPDIGELPWMKRDLQAAESLLKEASMHTTPLKLPQLPVRPSEQALHELYIQSEQMGAQAPPPPAVTIPMDRIQPKDRVFDDARGAVAITSPGFHPANEPAAEFHESTQPAAPSPVRPSLIMPNLPAPNKPASPIARQPLPVQKSQPALPGTPAPVTPAPVDDVPHAIAIPAPPVAASPAAPTLASPTGPPKLVIKRPQTPILENGKLRLPPKD